MSYHLEIIFQCPSAEITEYFVEQLPEDTRDVFTENLEAPLQKIIDAVRFWDYPEHIEVNESSVFTSWRETAMDLNNVYHALAGTGIQIMLACDVEDDPMSADEDSEYPGIEGVFYSNRNGELVELDITQAVAEIFEDEDDFISDYQLFYFLVEKLLNWKIEYLLDE